MPSAVSFVTRYDMRSPGVAAAQRRRLFGRAVEQAAYVDRMGHDALMLSEHHATDDGYLTSPLVLAAAVAARTERIPIMIAALLVNLYEPVRLAQDIEVLDQLGGGRVGYTFGLGYRPEEYALFDRPWQSRGADAEARIREVQQLLQRLGIAPLLFYGGGSRAAAARAARLGLHFQPQVADRDLADFYREQCREAGREPGLVVRPVAGPAAVFCASDPDRFWGLYGHHLLSDATAYQAWLGGQAAHIADASQTVEALRAAGRYVVLTPEQAVAGCRGGQIRLVTAHPLCGGLPEEPSWESLRLICEQVMPAVRPTDEGPDLLGHRVPQHDHAVTEGAGLHQVQRP